MLLMEEADFKTFLEQNKIKEFIDQMDAIKLEEGLWTEL